MLTLNQRIKALSNFASYHGQINSFGVGELEDFATSGTVTYPILWMTVENGSLNDTDNNTLVTQTHRIYLVDRQEKGQFNQFDVWGDMELVAYDLIAHFKSPTYYPQTGSMIDTSNIVLNAIYEKDQDDEVIGWWFDLVFKANYEENRCQIPFTSVIPIPTNPNSMSFADQEIPTGAINGVNTTYTLANTPIAVSVYVYYNGQLLTKVSDYSISGNVVTMGFAPETGSVLRISYRY